MFTPQHDHTPYGQPRKGDEAAFALAVEMLDDGADVDEIRELFEELGIDHLTADKYIQELKATRKPTPRPQSKKARKRSLRFAAAHAVQEAAHRHVRYGIFWFCLGMLLALGAWYLSFASDYLTSVAASTMLLGALMVLRGYYLRSFKG